MKANTQNSEGRAQKVKQTEKREKNLDGKMEVHADNIFIYKNKVAIENQRRGVDEVGK